MSMRWIVHLLCVAALASVGPGAGPAEQEPPKLLGRCTAEQLAEEPFAEWFRGGFEEYTPNPEVLAALRRAETDDLRVTIFFGTWCGDSQREVPRWLKLFETMAFPADRVALVAVDSTDEAYKRSPGGEERGLEIYRVPTVIVRRGETEIARIVEHPAQSIERDLLAILEGRPREPSYASYPVVRRWLREGWLGDPNVSPRGLADEVRHLVAGEGELTAAARVMLSRGDTAEAVKLFQVNCTLYRDSSSCQERLAGALLEAGDHARAREAAERALRLNDDPDRVESLVRLVERGSE